jgi:hypothetical protein
MKTIPTVATAILAIFLVLAPAVAFGATLTIKTASSSYSGTQTVSVTGQVTPPPTVPTSVVVTTKNPTGQVVDVGPGTVSMVDGTFAYNFVTGGTSAWAQGTYTVTGVWGSGPTNATQSTTFVYTPNPGQQTGTPSGYVIVDTASPLLPGQSVVGVLVVSSNPGTVTASYWAPGSSTATSLPAPTRLGGVNYVYAFTVALPASAASGVYLVSASVTNTTSGFSLANTGSFTVNGGIASSAAVAAVGANDSKIASTLTSMQATLSTISSGVTSANTGITSVNTNLTGLSGAGPQLAQRRKGWRSS